MDFFVNGTWQGRGEVIEVKNPFDAVTVDTVPKATSDDVDAAVSGAVKGAAIMGTLPGYQRFQILRKAADLILNQANHLAQTISQEEGKTLAESRGEVDRAAQTIELSGEEAKRLGGEFLPLDGSKGTHGQLGFTMRVPCGVVVAITPFNFPLNLVCHKVGPALAAGNAVVLKPASDTPLVALQLVEILLQAGLPPLAISCITGSGTTVGNALCRDRRVRKISFTGSREVGDHICRTAGMKKVTMELGGNCPIIVLPDADLAKVAACTAAAGYANAGQVCISAQRLIVAQQVHDALIAELQPKIEAIKVGNQLSISTDMGPMVREEDASRVESLIAESVSQGARRVCGGDRDRSLLRPCLIDHASSEMRVWREELFGPAVVVKSAASVNEAIALANDSDYGLSAGVFTRDIDSATRFAREIHCGNVHINWGPMWRTDAMPYGGFKASGLGKEGPKYAMQEMTELKTVVFHP